MVRSVGVAGKGGTGKTTIAALLVRYLYENNLGPVLAVDADPDANLGALLGVEPGHTIGDLREEVLRDIKDFPPGMVKANFVETSLHQVIVETAGFDLITMGRGEGPGCYCFLNNLIRKFSDSLMFSYSWVVIDNEAGLEHISRRTSTNIDALITVVDEDPNSFKTAKNIEQISKELKHVSQKRYVITNRVDPGATQETEKRLASLSMEYLGDIPFDKTLRDVVYRGDSLMGLKPFPFKDKMKWIVDRIGGQSANT